MSINCCGVVHIVTIVCMLQICLGFQVTLTVLNLFSTPPHLFVFCTSSIYKCMLSWNVLTSSTLVVQPCICTIALNGHARISSLHCQCLWCCALLQVKISLKAHQSHCLSQLLSHSLILKVNYITDLYSVI